MSQDYEVTLDTLVKDELDGKSVAIASYDEMLWKIRSGYAVLLYGSVGVIAGLVNEEVLDLNAYTFLAVGVLVAGFSLCGALIDYSFMNSKLRVVAYRDKLVEFAHGKAVTQTWEQDSSELLECLKNSGERKDPIDWSKRTGRLRPSIYYGGTCAFCLAALWLVVQHVPQN